MANEIPPGLVREAFMKTCEFSGAPVEEAIQILMRSEKSIAQGIIALKSPDCERLVRKIDQAESIKAVLDIRKDERGVARGAGVKRMLRILLIRRMYQIALKASAS